MHLPAKTDLERISDDSEAFVENVAGHAYALSLSIYAFPRLRRLLKLLPQNKLVTICQI